MGEEFLWIRPCPRPRVYTYIMNGVIRPRARSEHPLPPPCPPSHDMRVEWRELDRRIAAFDDEFAARVRSDEAARLLATIPGIGILNATALTAAIGSGHAFGAGPRPAGMAGAGAKTDHDRR